MSIAPNPSTIEYPSSDGKPMAENTLQFDWIVKLKEGLDSVCRNDPKVFVTGDLLWYPVEGDNKLRTAPDTMVAFGRPKGFRSYYLQWKENHIPPQVVFEVLSPGNRAGEMRRKRLFYEKYGVDEYYVIDPDRFRLEVWLRRGEKLVQEQGVTDWPPAYVSLAKITFENICKVELRLTFRTSDLQFRRIPLS